MFTRATTIVSGVQYGTSSQKCQSSKQKERPSSLHFECGLTVRCSFWIRVFSSETGLLMVGNLPAACLSAVLSFIICEFMAAAAAAATGVKRRAKSATIAAVAARLDAQCCYCWRWCRLCSRGAVKADKATTSMVYLFSSELRRRTHESSLVIDHISDLSVAMNREIGVQKNKIFGNIFSLWEKTR